MASLTYIVNKAAEFAPQQLAESYNSDDELDLSFLRERVSTYISQLEILVSFIDDYVVTVMESSSD